MPSSPSRRRAAEPRPSDRFTPANPRARHDGWTPEKQIAFIQALAAGGCVAEAAKAVGMSREGAYALRARGDAQSFRLAWSAAQDVAIRRITDEAFSRALNGVVVPHFYKGEQVGEHRRYDDRLAMFLMRYHDPLRYARSLDQMVYQGHPEGAAIGLAKALDRLADDAYGSSAADDHPPAPAAPWRAKVPSSAHIRAQAEALEQARAVAEADEEDAANDAVIQAESRTEFEHARDIHRGLPGELWNGRYHGCEWDDGG